MTEYFLQEFIRETKEHLKDNLCGIYLHGSLAMDCYTPGKSDVDLLIVIQNDISLNEKNSLIRKYMKLEDEFPLIHIEMSVILERDIQDFSHPTPYALHYSRAHKERYQSNPGYICSNGHDPDLAAHFTVTYERGVGLYGKPVHEMFRPIPQEVYMDSILFDIRDAEDGIIENPVYYILNYCRVLYYIEEGVVSSKREAGEWGKVRFPHFENLLSKALTMYSGKSSEAWQQHELIRFSQELAGLIGRHIQMPK